MKKLISLCLTFILIAGSIGTAAYAEETLPDLLFDLDIQVTDAEAGAYTIKDASTSTNNKAGKVKIIYGTTNTSDEAKKPILGKNDQDTYYIQFGDFDAEGKAINTDRPMQIDLGTDRNTENGVNDSYANRDALTFETWVSTEDWESYITTAVTYSGMFAFTGRREDNSATDYRIRGALHPVFKFTPGEKTSIQIQMRADTSLERYQTAGEGFVDSYKGITVDGELLGKNNSGETGITDNLYDAMSDSKWVHLVFVRKWTPYEPAQNGMAGKWNFDVYVNGQNVGSADEEKAERIDYNKVSSGYWWIDYDTLLLGRMDVNPAAATDPVVRIADFKMYDGALTAEQVAAKYDDTRARFMDVPDVTDGTIEALETFAFNKEEDGVNEVAINFTSPVKANSIIDGSIKILDDNGGEVATEVVPCAGGVKETDTVTIKINDYFAYDRSYTLDVSGVKDLAGSAVARKQITFTTANRSDVNITTNDLTVSSTAATSTLTVQNTGADPLKVGMFVMVYGSDGKIKKLAMTKGDDIKTITAGESATVTVTADGIQDGDEIRSMAYSIVEGKGRIAFTSPIELTVE